MKNRIIVIITFLAGIFLLNSCLKDDADYWKEDVAGKVYATVLTPALQSKGLKPVPDEVDFEFMINIATDVLPANDITVTMKVDPAAVTNYNKLTGKSYKALPTVKIVNPVVTIAAGTRTATIKCKLWGADVLNACDNYIAAVSIDKTSDASIIIPSNMKSYLLSCPISNPYEGKYHVTGVFSHPTAGDRAINEDKTLVTVDCKSVKTTVGDLGDYEVMFTVNEDNSITVGGAGLGASQPIVQGTGTNKYDPLTKILQVNYYYAGSGGNRVMTETYTRLP